jgi:hypothetical protein
MVHGFSPRTHLMTTIPLENASNDVARDLVTQKYILGMRILMLGFERAYNSRKKQRNGKSADIAKFVNEFRIMAARGAGFTVLSLAENLPKIIDKASMTFTDNVE